MSSASSESQGVEIEITIRARVTEDFRSFEATTVREDLYGKPIIIRCSPSRVVVVHKATDGSNGWQGTCLDRKGVIWDVRRHEWGEVISKLMEEGVPMNRAELMEGMVGGRKNQPRVRPATVVHDISACEPTQVRRNCYHI